jgi:hypothetical protein
VLLLFQVGHALVLELLGRRELSPEHATDGGNVTVVFLKRDQIQFKDEAMRLTSILSVMAPSLIMALRKIINAFRGRRM